MKQAELLWDGTEKYVPWTSLHIADNHQSSGSSLLESKKAMLHLNFYFVYLMACRFVSFTLVAPVANTGAALWYVHNNLYNTECDRPDARNILAFITDTPSTDDVSAAARALRESGVTVNSSRSPMEQ